MREAVGRGLVPGACQGCTVAALSTVSASLQWQQSKAAQARCINTRATAPG